MEAPIVSLYRLSLLSVVSFRLSPAHTSSAQRCSPYDAKNRTRSPVTCDEIKKR